MSIGLLLAGTTQPSSAFFGDVINVSHNPGFSAAPQIAVSDNGKIYIVWTDDNPSEIFFSVSDDGGLNFTEPRNISNDSATSNSPQLAVSGEDVYVVWFGSLDLNPEVYFSSSNNGGDTFSPPINLSNNTGNSLNPQIGILGSDIYVVWDDDDSAISSVPFFSDIAYRKSNNSGQDFGAIKNISHNDGLSVSPRIAISSNGNVYIAWQDDSFLPGLGQAIVFSASTDGNGNTFSEPAPLSAVEGYALISTIESSGTDNVYTSWYDVTGNSDVFFSSSDNAGASFTGPINISSDNLSFSDSPNIAVASNGKIWIVWRDEAEGSGDVFIANNSDSGLPFSEGVNLSESEFPSSFPQITISGVGNSIYVVWQNDLDLGGSKDIFFSGSIDGGETFSSPANVAINPQLSESQVIAMLDNTLLVVWSDSSNGNPDISFRAAVLDESSITIEQVDENPRWGTNVTAIGITTNAGSDTVTVDWGDGSENNDIPVIDNTWTATHSYNSSAVGERTIVARLINSGGTEDASSTPHIINVDKRISSIELNSIGSVIQGDDVGVDGELIDAVSGTGLGVQDITFNGTGSTNISNAITTGNGSFQTSGFSSNSTSTLWTVQAHFAGDSTYESSDSEVRTYDTASPSSSQFPVSAGSPSSVDLSGFNATVEFDNVISEGVLFVLECEEEPLSDRFLSLGLCLVLSSSARLASDSSFDVTTSFAGVDIPDGHLAKEVDLFHEETDGIVDITASRDATAQTVTGRTSSFSKFVSGIALHEEQPAGAARQQVYVGSDQVIVFYPVITRTLELDSASYSIDTSVSPAVSDPNANLDFSAVDTIIATISSTSDLAGINIILSETDQDTGVFTGLFSLTSSQSAANAIHVEPGDEIVASYAAQSDVPLEVLLDDTTESGMLQLNPYNVTGVAWGVIGNSYELELVDATLAPSSGLAITMSYSNVAEDDLESVQPEFDPARIIIVQSNITQPTQWVDITFDIELDNKAVTGVTDTASRYAMTYFTWFHGPGGGGGGLPRPGTGVVLDAIASVAAGAGGGGTDGSDSNGNGQSGGSGGGGNRKIVVTNPSLTLSPESDFEDRPLDRIEISSTGFLDVNGEEISYGSIGQQISIASKFTNQQQVPQNYSFIVMVLDEDGNAIDISWQDGMVESGKTVDLASSWTPGGVGTYTIKVFIWDDMDSPSPLTVAASNDIDVGANL